VTARQHFEALYAEHAGAVKGYAIRRVGPARADDVLAEVFLVVWRRLEQVPGSPRPWLLAVARRAIANERRSGVRQEAVREQLKFARAGEGTSLADPATALTLPDAPIRQALQSLSDADREALQLTAWEGLSNREAAHVLGIREATFSVRLHRAKRRLERALASSPQSTISRTRLETQ
jgi:RNA polymerase sigma-70 factor (ECF subfamily)